jgi:hypothetical protein
MIGIPEFRFSSKPLLGIHGHVSTERRLVSDKLEPPHAGCPRGDPGQFVELLTETGGEKLKFVGHQTEVSDLT